MGIINKLTSRHNLMISRLALEGLTPREVSEEFGITQGRLSILRSSPIWKDSEQRLQREVLENDIRRINSLREVAIGALKDCVESTDERIKLASARDILDRTGIRAGQSLDISGGGGVVNLYIPANWNVSDSDSDSDLDLDEEDSEI